MASSIHQDLLFPIEEDKRDTTSTFSDNLALPVHRWFRYAAGFSATWVRQLLEEQMRDGKRRVLDPFAGSGTVLLEGERCGMEAAGVESHPFVARVARAKLLWRESPHRFGEYANSILEEAQQQGGETSGHPPLITRCFPPETLVRLDSLRRVWAERADGSPQSELTWLALASILRECSPVGTAQWQYVLPNKTKMRRIDPYTAFASKVAVMSQDMVVRHRHADGPLVKLYEEDTRELVSLPSEWADVIVTSPPYANNYDYADATRLEMTFFRDIGGWGDLQGAVRRYLIPSCTQHVSSLVKQTNSIIDDPLLAPIRDELSAICGLLLAERAQHNGKKNYHTMIAAYFREMAKVWVALRRVTRAGATVCFVIGDSAPYGVYVPVDRWLGELAIASGFESYTFEKTRDRNVKWKNRKHRVPLHEGRLWVRG